MSIEINAAELLALREVSNVTCVLAAQFPVAADNLRFLAKVLDGVIERAQVDIDNRERDRRAADWHGLTA